MPVLSPADYDQLYFDGAGQDDRHPAGYSRYQKCYRFDGADSRGEVFLDLAARLATNHVFANKSVLELGCAKGFIIEALRNFLGIEAYGLDVSAYAIGQADPSVADYLTQADARTYLQNYSNNQFDFILSISFLECIDDADLPNLIDQMNRISRKQVHLIYDAEKLNPDYYNVKPLSQWASYQFRRGTILINKQSGNIEVV